MNDTGTRQRRSLVVMILDGVLRLLTITPEPKIHEPGGARHSRGHHVLAAGVLAALVATVVLAVVLIRAAGGSTAQPDPAAALPVPPARSADPAWPLGSVAPTASITSPAGATSSSARTSPSATDTTGSGSSAPVTESTTVALTAAYETSSVTAGLLGYTMTVTVANPGATVKNGWTLTVTLPRATLLVGQVTGATAAQDGSTWTFVPDETTADVPAGGSVVVSFGVNGATLIDAAPKTCTIDGNACTT
ncbi:cellulose binding domain-containing protein [Actinoplanes sp. NPDC051851]|uniref:cellulose binding domain-containing protein n=1 Tax=Actinoplanes sp. NPDC051851 TaxID=3154753 RepID=UPI0034217686